MRATIAFALCLMVTAAVPAWADQPDRTHGISMHMLPRRVADLDGRPWGLVVAYAEHLKPESAQPVLQTASDFLAFTRKQDAKVQAHGVWIVTTHPAAYSETETKLLEDVKTLCRSQRIPLFIARGSELPAGWQRYDE